MQGVWTAFLTLTGSYGQLLDYVIFAALVFYVLTMVALFALRRKIIVPMIRNMLISKIYE